MITVKRECEDGQWRVVLETETDLPVDLHDFTHCCGDANSATAENYSYMLVERLKSLLGKKMKDIREEAYNQGWDDKRKKENKRTGFYASWNPINVGWVK